MNHKKTLKHLLYNYKKIIIILIIINIILVVVIITYHLQWDAPSARNVIFTFLLLCIII